MTTDELVFRAKDIISVMLLVAAPAMVSSFVVGMLLSFLQAIFQIHEHTFSFVPKLLVIMLSLVVCASWMLDKLKTFTIQYLSGFDRLIQ